MRIYEAKTWSGNIEVRSYEIEKETNKQIKYNKGNRLNKSMIGKCNIVRTGYGYTSNEAIRAVKNDIIEEIKNHELSIKMLNNELNLPIKIY
ncbi:hypothetical protein [Clostridium beijerinckii]|uniref:hypothetical protein n=1 Tax=Clostridium beijerinckii TaxID=1520 RepID=UPI0015710004|nr:hypothetical protein [Clostridium beijerinckii]NRU52495.1 hypothetical protein [Clostridium beijerinckii]NYC69060.1 hypothetical protein [Clostridium beijerinckii]NYC91696.1 hypothetical protein [Clostridium beijerinckii]